MSPLEDKLRLVLVVQFRHIGDAFSKRPALGKLCRHHDVMMDRACSGEVDGLLALDLIDDRYNLRRLIPRIPPPCEG